MTRNGRKRSRDEYEADNRMGMGQTLSHLNGPTAESASPEAHTEASPLQEPAANDDRDGAGEWQKVDRSQKRKKKQKQKKAGDNHPSISHSSHSRLQSFVKVGDLQNLVLYLLADGTAPQWCAVRHHANIRKVVVLMVPGLGPDMFDGKILLSEPREQAAESNGETTAADSSELAQRDNNATASTDTADDSSFQLVKHRKAYISPDDYYPNKLIHSRLPEPLQPLSGVFDHIWPIKTPGDDKYAKMHSPLGAMLIAPIVKTKEEKKAKGPRPPSASKDWKNQRTPICEFVATTEELVDEGYVLHPAHCNSTRSAREETAKREVNKTAITNGWVDTLNVPNVTSDKVPDKEWKTLAMDCEMCITSPKGVTPQVFSLTRISMINWDGEVVLDELVKPEQQITDYLTPYSGITAAALENVTTTLADVQKKLIDEILTPQTILIGHSLNADLNALHLTHPYIIDTAFLFPHPRGPPLKSSLKWLAQKYLQREIQKGHGSTGHDSVEDARACLDLLKQKCEKGKAWGTSEASGESIFKRLGRQVRPKRDKVNPIGDDEPRIGAVVDWGEPSRGYGSQARVSIGCESDEQVVAGVRRAVEGDEDDAVVPKGGVDFVFGRLRELESHCGWWNRSKTVDNEALRNNASVDNDSTALADAVMQTVQHIRDVYDALPPCSAFIVYSGSGDPRELADMQAMQERFKQEYKVKKWDELSVKWTDDEEQKLRRACEKARKGVGFITVK